jgi:ergothioneine biosynthesis protein EgtB
MNDAGVVAEDSPARALLDRYRRIRAETGRLSSRLSPEDQCVQSMPDASPVKWHRAHTTWFFEEFLLRQYAADYRPFDPAFRFLFNSYYEAVGPRHPRPMRGMLTRPSAQEITAYRSYVDAAMAQLLPAMPPEAAELTELGLQHEQQHQELIVTDLLHAFGENPTNPAWWPDWTDPAGASGTPRFLNIAGGIFTIGHQGNGFCFDNEMPAHEVLLRDFQIGSHLARNSDWLAFMADGGYRTATLWMSDGWTEAQSGGWHAPLYWEHHGGDWLQFGPGGLQPLNPEAPVRHISWYEADAFARWSGARLPTEAEWEVASAHPDFGEAGGHVWQWTGTAYAPYPAYHPAPGAVGEYNGKFMINQMVLRGSSLATPAGHSRRSYRNFFHPGKRWQFSGLRLARDV